MYKEYIPSPSINNPNLADTQVFDYLLLSLVLWSCVKLRPGLYARHYPLKKLANYKISHDVAADDMQVDLESLRNG